VTGPLNDRVTTVVDAFHESCKMRPHKDFLGWRDKTKEGQPYVWKTWQESRDYVDNLARGIQALDMMEDIQSEGKTWRFMGIYGKNRAEWVLTDLAAATLGGTTIAFYDTLGPAAIEFVIK
jgi:long-chain acyl-CoA synthetase